MVIKVKGLTVAKVSGGGSGSAVTYTGGKVDRDKIVRVDQSEERSDVSFYADDHRIDRDNSISAASVSIELAKLTDDMKKDMLGYVEGTGGTELQATDAESPYVGVGFIHGEMYCGTASYRAYWYYKVQFSRGQRSFNTKGEQTAFQTESLEGEAMGVQLEENGSIVFFAESGEVATEAAARAWLNGKAGVQA